MGEGGEARPLPFLTPRQDAEAEVDESGKNLTQWQLHTEALNLLRSIQDPVAVVAITGKYRTGKSFLANRLLEAVGGGSFQVGSTVEACTKGIWIWGMYRLISLYSIGLSKHSFYICFSHRTTFIHDHSGWHADESFVHGYRRFGLHGHFPRT